MINPIIGIKRIISLCAQSRVWGRCEREYGVDITQIAGCQTAHYGRRFLRINFGVFAYPIVPRDFRLHGIIGGTARYRSLISAA